LEKQSWIQVTFCEYGAESPDSMKAGNLLTSWVIICWLRKTL
jgi:hypothetical protein